MLIRAIEDNNIPRLQRDVVGETPKTLSGALLHTIYSIRPEAVTVLLDAGADPNFKGWGATPLINVTSGDVARLLLSRGADPNRGVGTKDPLSSAIADRKVPVIEALLEHPATIVTPQDLHSAVTSFLPLDRVIRPMMQRTDPRKKVDGYDVAQALENRVRLLQGSASAERPSEEYIEEVKKMVKRAYDTEANRAIATLGIAKDLPWNITRLISGKVTGRETTAPRPGHQARVEEARREIDAERSKDRQEKLTADQETFLASLSPDDRAAAEAAKGGRRKTRLRKTRRRRTLRRKQ